MENSQTEAARILDHRRRRLIDTFIEGRAENFLESHARLIDAYFIEGCAASPAAARLAETAPCALVALGGYGRKEQCIHSDVDLLILFADEPPPEAEALVREVVYPLWDVGLYVGHHIRSLTEELIIPADGVSVLTALLDARFIHGSERLFSQFAHRFRREVIAPNPRAQMAWLIDTNWERHDRFGDSSYLLEPNLKEGEGGLRDYHTLLWAAKIDSAIASPKDLPALGLISQEEHEALREALDLIFKVRNHLHHLAGRKHDQLRFAHQEKMAAILGYEGERNGQQPVERFLGRLHQRMSVIKELHRVFIHEMESRHREAGRNGRSETGRPDIEVRRGMLHFASPEAVLRAPALMMHIFDESARLRMPLSAEAKRLIRHMLPFADERFRRDPAVIAAFERILTAPVYEFNALDEMMGTGLLIRFIPQFDAIHHRIQYDEYHLYPVDKHVLKTVRVLKRFGDPDSEHANEMRAALYADLGQNRRLLLWGALLHDVGKGEPGGRHSEKGARITAEILANKGFPPGDIDRIRALVEEHLLIAKTATRRDIHDEETAVFCARRIGDETQLKMLYLLTVADSISTGPKAFNSWTLSLMRGLYYNVLSSLRHGELATREAEARVAEKRAALEDRAAEDPAARRALDFFDHMSPRYRLYTEPAEMIAHAPLVDRLGNDAFVWDIRRHADMNTRIMTVCARNRRGLFSRIAGTLTLNGVDILNAQIYTWKNNLAVDVFHLSPPPDPLFENERWDKAAADLNLALSDRLDLAAELRERLAASAGQAPPGGRKPPRAVVDNDTSGHYTIIEVYADDFPGLLFTITDALYRCDLDIWLAKIATQVDQVVDVFYVWDENEQKVTDPAAVAAIRDTVETAISRRGPG